MKIRAVILFLFLVCGFGKAQKENLSSYHFTTVSYKFHPKFFFYAEGMLRGIEEYFYPDYFEVKGGVGYYLTKDHKPFIGIGRYGTYKNRRNVKEEICVWLQDVVDVHVSRVKLENRLRLEQTWMHEPLTDTNSDRFRIRYRLNVSAPLNSRKAEPGTVSANVYDEIFIIPAQKQALYRNWMYGGLAYKIDKTTSLAAGYLFQHEFGEKARRNLHYLVIGVNFSLDGTLPSPVDPPGE